MTAAATLLMALPTKEEVEKQIAPLLKNLPIDLYPLVAFGIRGWFKDMGEKGKNDRGIWDDVNGFIDRLAGKVYVWVGNCDPTAKYRKRLGSVHAPQVLWFKIGPHRGRDAYRQAATFWVDRDGIGLVEASKDCAFNWHDSVNKAQTTSSLGCQTNKKKDFAEVKKVGDPLIRKYYPKTETFPFILVDVSINPSINPVPDAVKMPKSLVKGMRGSAVLDLQHKLELAGKFVGKKDGIFGRILEGAVIAYQKEKGLVPDGKAGPKTLAMLRGISLVKPAPAGGLDSLKKGTAPWYSEAYRIMGYDPGFEKLIKAGAARVLKGQSRYEAVAKVIGCPWWVIGVIHSMEASCNFAGVLHNGEKIIGKGVKTKIVPIGRGPFKTWEAAAIDALKMKGFDKVKDWSIGNILRLLELYNGAGHLKYHTKENSPYLWAMTTINDGTGKYLSDGKWNEVADANKQVGCAALIKELETAACISLAA